MCIKDKFSETGTHTCTLANSVKWFANMTDLAVASGELSAEDSKEVKLEAKAATKLHVQQTRSQQLQ